MKRNLWPYSIVAYFVVFVSVMATWIVFAVRNDHELVRKDYYEHELKYQSELDSFERAAIEPVVVNFNPANRLVTFNLPKAARATVQFYRPSDARLDRQFAIGSHDSLDLRDLAEGLWKVHLAWSDGDQTFRHDTSIVLPAQQ